MRRNPSGTGVGNVIDWRLRYRLEDPESDASAARQRWLFRQWRSQFVIDRLAGDCAAVAAFLDWADRNCDVSLLHVLRLDEGRIRSRDVPRAGWQAGRAGAAMRASGELGVGVIAASNDSAAWLEDGSAANRSIPSSISRCSRSRASASVSLMLVIPAPPGHASGMKSAIPQ
jgi:hypothetical protein